MIEFTTAQITAWVMSFFWPFVRILAFVATAPIIGGNSTPRKVQIGLAVLLAVIIAPTLEGIPDIPPVSYAGVLLIGQQIIIGVALGIVMRVVFAAIQAAGAYIGLQMGLSFSNFFSTALGGHTTVLSRFLNLFAVLMFLAVNGHLIMIRLLAHTFAALPVGTTSLNPSAWQTLVQWGSTVFAAGLILALPLVCALLAAHMAMGILNRASPQLTIFSIGFPVTLLAGITMLMFMAPELGRIFTGMFQAGFDMMLLLLRLLGAPG